LPPPSGDPAEACTSRTVDPRWRPRHTSPLRPCCGHHLLCTHFLGRRTVCTDECLLSFVFMLMPT
jgi:hypothetical protein